MMICIPFILQALLIAVDEYYFHLKRGLPRWERIGHPIDTLSVLLCLFFVLFVPFSIFALKWYVGLSLFSCLMVTKDEFVHKHHCPAAENWLHALLFINHPVLLTCAGLIWCFHESLRTFLWTQTLFAFLFFFYQIIYWNFLCKQKPL